METDPTVRYSIVVPFFNEQENIPPLYMKLTEVMDSIGEPYELIFVDDGSKDNTFKVLSDIYEHDRRVNLIRLRRNFGQTPALKAGFDFARGEVIISMDGDLQHDPEEIPKFLEKIEEGYDLVSGWRYARRDHWLMRQIPSRTANWLMAKLSGVDLHDFGTTFKAYRREILSEIQLYGELHRFIPALASTTGARIVEVPIENLQRKAGRSNYGISRTIRVFLDLLMVKFLLDYSTRPLQFFGLLGIAGTGSGLLIGAYVLFKKLYYHMSVMQQHGPLMLLSIALLVSGIQFISMGLLGEIMARTYYESQNKPIYALREVKSHRKEIDSAEQTRPSGNNER
ncbi:MAG TPA: glycosyltransferase family 2 protein [Candidatus Acidoferrum sp.]|nr:glycosyltransferase family 2 protein [Candidatus Acidoferrum sp.]